MTAEDRPQDLARSWAANADGWTRAVREGRIPSRRAATDAAVLEAILEREPRSVLDLGCGEGWLARALAERGVEVVGVDGSASLVEAARRAGGGRFLVRSFADVAAAPESLGAGFDVAVCNFALLEPDVAPMLLAVGRVLAPRAALVVQTVHPWSARGDAPYRDGWRVETFAQFGPGFPQAMPWYFRTLQSWVALLRDGGFAIREIREPAHPDSGEPLSLLLVCEAADPEGE